MGAQVYTALMSACVSTGHMQKAQEVFAKIGSPDAKAFTTLTQGYLKHQDVASALRVLETALEQRVQVEQELIDNTLFMANHRPNRSAARNLAGRIFSFRFDKPKVTFKQLFGTVFTNIILQFLIAH